MEGMSERKYSSHSGLSRGAIQKARKAGRLVVYSDGSINAAASDVRRADMTDPDQQRRSTGGDSGFSGPADSSSYLKARTALTVYQAQERQLAIQKKKGLLIDRARAEALVFRLARQERDVWVTWPARVAALMAAQVAAEVEKQTAKPVMIEAAILQRVLETLLCKQAPPPRGLPVWFGSLGVFALAEGAVDVLAQQARIVVQRANIAPMDRVGVGVEMAIAEGLDACQHVVDLEFGREESTQGFVVRGGGAAGGQGGHGSIFLVIRGAGCIAPTITFALTSSLINNKNKQYHCFDYTKGRYCIEAAAITGFPNSVGRDLHYGWHIAPIPPPKPHRQNRGIGSPR